MVVHPNAVTLLDELNLVLPLQLIWAAGAATWNVIGVKRVAKGEIGLGPTASLLVAGVAVVAGILFLTLPSRSPMLYGLLSALTAAMAFFAVYSAFTRDPALWPSEAWRWAGIVLNGLGTLACLAAAWIVLT